MSSRSYQPAPQRRLRAQDCCRPPWYLRCAILQLPVHRGNSPARPRSNRRFRRKPGLIADRLYRSLGAFQLAARHIQSFDGSQSKASARFSSLDQGRPGLANALPLPSPTGETSPSSQSCSSAKALQAASILLYRMYVGSLAALSARCAQFSAFSRKISDCFMIAVDISGGRTAATTVPMKYL